MFKYYSKYFNFLINIFVYLSYGTPGSPGGVPGISVGDPRGARWADGPIGLKDLGLKDLGPRAPPTVLT